MDEGVSVLRHGESTACVILIVHAVTNGSESQAPSTRLLVVTWRESLVAFVKTTISEWDSRVV